MMAPLPQVFVKQKIVHTVKQGDTLSHIALKYGTTVNQLVAYNRIRNSNMIYENNNIVVMLEEKVEFDV